ncbi:MAG: alpha/beta hydrolase [Chloroflexi bacterium]|jgi:pimeloyl-ACP methyl ester carboxylesterase|nr:alpha/beta hydrolase [Chloroflexota bacterium]
MTASRISAGYFRCGLPYNRVGHGPRPLVVFQGLMFENKPLSRWMARRFNGYQFLETDYTLTIVNRKPGLPAGCTLQAMANDYAAMIREEFDGPIDVIGVSTGGSIAQHFAADHSNLVQRLVLHSTAHTLGAAGRDVQLRTAAHAGRGDWQAAHAAMLGFMLPHGAGLKGAAGRLITRLGAYLLSRRPPRDASDLVVTVQAEDAHHFKDRLAEITAPTLVVAGEQDPFYTAALFRETAEGIPNARLILYPGMGHPASGAQFQQDVLAFLRKDR